MQRGSGSRTPAACSYPSAAEKNYTAALRQLSHFTVSHLHIHGVLLCKYRSVLLLCMCFSRNISVPLVGWFAYYLLPCFIKIDQLESSLLA